MKILELSQTGFIFNVLLLLPLSVLAIPANISQPIKWTKLGQGADLLCATTEPQEGDVTICRWMRYSLDDPETPTITINATNDSIAGQTDSGIYEFSGSGMTNGECGLTIKNIQANQTGKWGCNLIGGGIWNGEILVTLYEKPKAPVITENLLQNLIYKDRNSLARVICCVDEGKPIEDLKLSLTSWDETKILSGKCEEKDCTPVANRTCIKGLKRIQPADNGKNVKCTANHPGYDPTDVNTVEAKFDVKFAPTFVSSTNDSFYKTKQENGHLVLSFIVKSNPKPNLVRLDAPSEKFEPNMTEIQGEIDEYEFQLIMDDIPEGNHTYILEVSNEYGNDAINVTLTIVSPPPGADPDKTFWIMVIVGIVMAVIFISIIIFMLNQKAKRKGWWCYQNRTRNYSVDRTTVTNLDENASSLNEFLNVPRVQMRDDQF